MMNINGLLDINFPTFCKFLVSFILMILDTPNH